MNDILDIEKMRYTVRSYSDKELEKEKLDKILDVGRWAPTEESKPNNTLSSKRLPIEKTVFYNQYNKE